jgi:hypothetical protein
MKNNMVLTATATMKMMMEKEKEENKMKNEVRRWAQHHVTVL